MQTFVTPRGEAQNVRFEQRENGIVHIFYDIISSDPRAVFSVMLEASQDSGTTFGMRPQSVTGDTGDGISPGPGKRIVWDSGKDVERVQIDSFRFRIVTTAGPLEVETPPAPVTGAQPPVSQPQQAAKKGGSGKWLLLGGGAAAAAAGAALAGGGGGPTTFHNKPVLPPTNRPPTIESVSLGIAGTLLATATRQVFFVTASDPDNDPMVATWDFGNGTFTTGSLSAGTALTEWGFNNAGTFTPSVTVSDGVAASGSRSYPAVTVGTVTGGWQAQFATFPGLFSPMNLNQNGRAVNGDAVYAGNAYRISGNVGELRELSLVFTRAADGAVFTMFTFGSADLRTFSGTGTGAGGPIAWSMTRR